MTSVIRYNQYVIQYIEDNLLKNEDDFESIKAAFKSITDPKGNHEVKELLKSRVSVLKEIIDNDRFSSFKEEFFPVIEKIISLGFVKEIKDIKEQQIVKFDHHSILTKNTLVNCLLSLLAEGKITQEQFTPEIIEACMEPIEHGCRISSCDIESIILYWD